MGEMWFQSFLVTTPAPAKNYPLSLHRTEKKSFLPVMVFKLEIDIRLAPGLLRGKNPQILPDQVVCLFHSLHIPDCIDR